MSKRNTFMTGPMSKPPRSPLIEAARHLQNTARRFIAERASERDMEEAIEIWRDAQAKYATKREA